ncbi:MAG: hypothetical protein ISS79_10790, partial [Phycisphaerae bacterium]|nr:hypothetical protein [Phycisphaerae bacterium]
FTGQYFDFEIEEYYLRASSLGDISVGDRPLWDMQYYPQIARFTARDPVFGNPHGPMSLHKWSEKERHSPAPHQGPWASARNDQPESLDRIRSRAAIELVG